MGVGQDGKLYEKLGDWKDGTKIEVGFERFVWTKESMIGVTYSYFEREFFDGRNIDKFVRLGFKHQL